jgi:hypothetical protein
MEEEKNESPLINVPQRNADGSYPPVALPNGTYMDYDSLSEDEYFKAMEKKVEAYKQQFPDMYEKATKWLAMLNESEIYKANAPNDPEVQKAQMDTANDIMKNALFNGFSADEIAEKDAAHLDKFMPDWKKTLEDNLTR